MHIPEAVLSPPVAIATGVLAAGGYAWCLRKLERGLGDRTTVLMGIMSAFVFAAQMVNFPVGPGVSGHLMGGVLAAVMLGPWAGAVVIGAVLLVQCLLFADGGLTALGANFLNMGLIGAVGGYAIYAPIRRAVGGPRGVLLGAMAAAWLSVILSSGAFAVELAASGRSGDFLTILGWMVLVHAAIGLGEAVITGLVLRFILLTRPDLIAEPEIAAGSAIWRRGQVVFTGVALSLAVAIFLAPFASAWPDGLEFVGGKFRFLAEEAPSVLEAPIPDYEMPGLRDMLGVATAVAGVVGTLVVFVVGVGLARTFGRSTVAVPSIGEGRGVPGGVGSDAA
jgi:cobalt/nickel transport system permease protein